jgi:hypothetical protein
VVLLIKSLLNVVRVVLQMPAYIGSGNDIGEPKGVSVQVGYGCSHVHDVVQGSCFKLVWVQINVTLEILSHIRPSLVCAQIVKELFRIQSIVYLNLDLFFKFLILGPITRLQPLISGLYEKRHID